MTVAGGAHDSDWPVEYFFSMGTAISPRVGVSISSNRDDSGIDSDAENQGQGRRDLIF